MTVDPFDELEQQLRTRVAAARVKRRSRWRAHPFLAVLAAGAVTASGVAVAANGLRSGPDDKQRGDVIAYAVLTGAAQHAACRSPSFVKDGPTTFLDAAPPQAVLSAFPWMREPAPAAELGRSTKILKASHPVGGTVVYRSTIRRVKLDARWSVLIRLDRGQGGFSVRDAAACMALRDKMLEQSVANENPGVRDEARRVIANDTTVNPEAMTLWVFLLSHGRPTSGAGQPLLPGPGTGPRHEVHRGLLMNSSGSRAVRGRYLGLADPTTVRLDVWTKRAEVRRNLPKSISVHRGFWQLELPRRTGPVRLTEIAPDGSKGRVVRIRG